MKKQRNMRPFAAVLVVLLCSSLLIAESPATLTQSVTDGVETITLQMTLESIRGSNFEVLVQNSSGTYDTHTAAAVSTYIGTVDEYPGAIAAGILKSDGDLWAKVYFDRGYTWFTLGSSKYGERGDMAIETHMPTRDSAQPGHAGTTTYQWDQCVDVAWDTYAESGAPGAGDPATCLEQVEFTMMQLKAIYLTDALLVPALSRVVMRGSETYCPYEGVSDRLVALRDEWRDNHSDAQKDLVALSAVVGGGVAWVGVVGEDNGCSINGADTTYGNFDIVARHEIGHNWGGGDNYANRPEGHTIMCGNGYGRFSGPVVEAIFNERDEKLSLHLDSLGTYSTIDVPPYATLDVVTVQAGSGSVTIDVQINDHDANADSISLSTFDAVSANGNAVILSSGTGPGGRNELIYTPGSEIGLDSFYYTIIDDSTLQQTATGLVLIYTDLENTLKGYWNLDETSGTTAGDLSIFGRSATLQNDLDFAANSVTGQFGGALEFDGVDDYVSVVNYAGIAGTKDRTVSAWIKTTTTGAIVSWGGSGQGEKMTFRVQSDNGTAGAIRLEVNGGYIVGTTNLRDNQWHHVAVVLPNDGNPDVNEALLYVDGVYDGVSASASEPIDTVVDVDVKIGNDRSNRYFTGAIDDVRIYDYALSQTEIQTLVDGGSAESPSPYDGATDVRFGVLNWTPSAAATSNEVYVGTDLTAVTNATTASPEYQGATTTAGFIYGIQPTATYYWRVDSVTPSGTQKGTVWTFTTASTIDEDRKYLEQNSSGNGRLKTTGVDVELAAAGTTGDAVEWELIPAGSGVYYIRNISDGGLLRAVDTANVDLASANTLDVTTRWELQMDSGDWMFIVSAANGQKLHRDTGVLVNFASPVYTGPNVQWTMVDVPDTVPPAVPVGLTAATTGNPPSGPVVLDWDDNTESDLSGYRIYRAISEAGPFSLIANNVYVSEYEDQNTTDGNVYFYAATAFDLFYNASALSDPAYASLRIKGDLDGDNSVTLLDFALFSQNWLDTDCWYCNGADLSGDEQVDMGDMQIMAENWLTE
ncbi:MAG: LamG-like jellyroll fold domain-containing protein [Planctomycetota bacterium]